MPTRDSPRALRLLLIRHAQTTWNASGRAQGQADPPLSDLGRAQCQALGARFAGTRLDAIHSSDLDRALRTAAAVGAASATPVTAEPGLREVGLGEWEGINLRDLGSRYPELAQRWRDSPSWDLPPGGEGEMPFRSRVRGTVEGICGTQRETATVALVTHIGVIRTVLSMVTGLESRGQRWPWALDNTSITSLHLSPGAPLVPGAGIEVLAVNDAVHLEGLAAPA